MRFLGASCARSAPDIANHHILGVAAHPRSVPEIAYRTRRTTATLQNQIEFTAFSVQFVPGIWRCVFDFAAHLRGRHDLGLLVPQTLDHKLNDGLRLQKLGAALVGEREQGLEQMVFDLRVGLDQARVQHRSEVRERLALLVEHFCKLRRTHALAQLQTSGLRSGG
eukprot:1419527-Rhodomonas_salina.1